MPAPSAPADAPLTLLCGEDDFAVQQRAQQLYREWCAAAGGFDHEIIDAMANNSGEALRALARLREALQTLPFFGTSKVIWYRDCNFLADDRTGSAQAVAASLNELAQELQALRWDNVRLMISTSKVDRRKTFFKMIEKVGHVEFLAGLTIEDRNWADRAEAFARQELRARHQPIIEEALVALVAAVGPHLRQLSQEVEKLALYAGNGREITVDDVATLVARNNDARAFALGEALGDRDLSRLLRILDSEFWEMKFDRNKSPIGLLYGLIAKVRVLLLLRECFRAGFLKPESDYSRFKTQLERIPSGRWPEDKRYNPAAIHPFTLFKAVPQTARYTTAELVQAMQRLLACNLRLVASGVDEALALQQAVVQIVGPSESRRTAT